MTTTILIRTDPKVKKRVKSILKKMGLDMSSAINLYLHQIEITESIPFTIRTVNGFTPQQEKEMLRELEEAKGSGKKFQSVDAMFRDILGEWPLKSRRPATRLRSRKNSEKISGG